ncbi:MAG TPA: hypothetical protein VG013_25020, partial [Gemmataceae bacterium]|nr:hypothetical protein [Gemmataceae bacterium]
LPAAAILLGWTAYWILRQSRRVGLLLLLLLVCTNVFQRMPFGYYRTRGTVAADNFPAVGEVGFPLFGYVYELTHHLDEPEWALCEYLRKHGRPGDVVLATYGDLPLQFYTGLRVVGGFQGQRLPADPDWIIPRRFILTDAPGKDRDVRVFIRERIDLARYSPVPVRCRDFPLANNADPACHRFKAPAAGPFVLLVHRRNSRSDVGEEEAPDP